MFEEVKNYNFWPTYQGPDLRQIGTYFRILADPDSKNPTPRQLHSLWRRNVVCRTVPGIVPELNKVSHTDGRSVKAEINVSRHLEGSVRLAMAVLFRFSILKWLEGTKIQEFMWHQLRNTIIGHYVTGTVIR